MSASHKNTGQTATLSPREQFMTSKKNVPDLTDPETVKNELNKILNNKSDTKFDDSEAVNLEKAYPGRPNEAYEAAYRSMLQDRRN